MAADKQAKMQQQASAAPVAEKHARTMHNAALAFPLTNEAGLHVRPMLKEDLPAAAAICQNAFNVFNASVGLPPEFPPVEVVDVPSILLGQAFTDGFEGFVAVSSDGSIVGSNLVELRDEVAGIGPISVATGGQNAGAGRLLMQACMQAAAKRGLETVRLHQIGSNAKSFSLYLDLGFTPLLTCGQYEGFCTAEAPAGFVCEPLSANFVEACSALHKRACGVHRRQDIAAMLESPHPHCVVLDAGTREVVAYTTGSFLSGHTVAASDEAFKALVVFQSRSIQAQQAAGAPLPPTTLFVPHAYAHLLRWLAKNGFRLNRQIVQMGYGADEASAPGGVLYFPAIQY